MRLRQRGASKHLQTAPGTQWQIQVGNRRSGPVTPPIASDCRLPGAGPATAPLGAAFPEPPPAPPSPLFSIYFGAPFPSPTPRDESGAHRSARELLGFGGGGVGQKCVPLVRPSPPGWGEGGVGGGGLFLAFYFKN